MLKIKNILTIISNFISNIVNSLLAFPKVLLMSKLSLKINKTKSKKATILGNGPSLKVSLENDLDFIQKTEIFCVNNFASYPQFSALKPQNYVMLDPAYFLFSAENNARKDVEKTLNELKKVDWELNLFLPSHAKKSYLVNEINKNTKINIQFFNYTIIKGFAWLRHWFFNQNLGMPQCQNILGATLYLTIHQRFEEVYLFGADHSWHEELLLDENNQIIGRQLHFYDQQSNVSFQQMSENKLSKIYMVFQSLAKAFYTYEVLNQYAKHNQVRVFNVSAKSYIDSFEKIKLDK